MKLFSFITFVYCLMINSNVVAQSLDLWIISPAGSSSVSSATSLDWTLGETFVSSIETSHNRLYTEGFHQPLIKVFAIENIIPQISATLQIAVYPNPASTALNISLDRNMAGEFEYRLVNSTGTLLANGYLSGGAQTTLNVSNYTPGSYWLQIVDKNPLAQDKKVKNYQIVLQ